MKIAGLLIAALLTACVIETGPDEPEPGGGGGSSTDEYSNHIKLECNGTVLIDRTFTSKAECEDFRSSHSYSCGPVPLSFSC